MYRKIAESVLTYFGLIKDRITFFQPKTITVTFAYLTLLIFQYVQLYLKMLVCSVPCSKLWGVTLLISNIPLQKLFDSFKVAK